jgi:predicted RNA polymerase sigma factor
MVCGLTTGEIARSFLTSEGTIAQRIVRAKRTLAASGLSYETPRAEALTARLPSVLSVVYLIFNEGYTAARGDDWLRPQLCHEALRLGRMLTAIAPGEPEVHGLVALMELNASRAVARIAEDGEPILLMNQDRRLWDQLQIRRGLAALARARRLAADRGDPTGGPYALQAAIIAQHAEASTAADTNWSGIATLYETLARIAPSPVVELNRSIAVGMAEGPEAGLALLQPLLADPALRAYHLLPSVHGDMLRRLGRHDEARAAFEAAAALAQNRRERDLLQRRAREAHG